MKYNEISNTTESLEGFITRYEMARIFVRVDENILNNEQAYVSGIENLVGDYYKIPDEYVSFVERAYFKGLITGIDNEGTFAGGKTGTRAEASTMIVRLIDEDYRIPVNAAGRIRWSKYNNFTCKLRSTNDIISKRVLMR